MKCSLNFDPLEAVQVFKKIKKRDGKTVGFDSLKITSAITRAGKSTGEFDQTEAIKLTVRVLELAHASRPGPLPEVEQASEVRTGDLFHPNC